MAIKENRQINKFILLKTTSDDKLVSDLHDRFVFIGQGQTDDRCFLCFTF